MIGEAMFRPLLIPFIVLAGWIGTAYVFGDPVRTSTPSFASARELAPMQAWGVLFLAGALVLTASALARDGRAAKWALFIGGCIYAWWGFLFGLTTLHDPKASLNAPALYGFLSFIHFLAANPELLVKLLRRKAQP